MQEKPLFFSILAFKAVEITCSVENILLPRASSFPQGEDVCLFSTSTLALMQTEVGGNALSMS